MNQILSSIKIPAISFSLALFCAQVSAQSVAPSPGINMDRAREIITKINEQFSKDYLNADSVALASYYTEDAEFGHLKGKEILAYWGNAVTNSIQTHNRILSFTTSSISTDGEFLVELGIFELKDQDNSLKKKGKYLTVYKQEGGRWKIYRDVSL